LPAATAAPSCHSERSETERRTFQRGQVAWGWPLTSRRGVP